jgi:hypothetical protein
MIYNSNTLGLTGLQSKYSHLNKNSDMEDSIMLNNM